MSYRVPLDHCGAPLGTLGSFGHDVGAMGFIGFIQACPGGRRVIRIRWVHSCAAEVVEFIGFVGYTRVRLAGRSIHSGEPWKSWGSLGFVGFISARARGHWVHSGLLVSCLRDLGSSGLFGFTHARPGCGWVYSGSFQRVMGVAGFIRVHLPAAYSSSDSFVLVWVIRGRTIGLGDHSSSLGTVGCDLGVIEFIPVRCFHSDAHWVSSGSFWFVRFILARPWHGGVYLGSLGSYGRYVEVRQVH